MTIPMFDLSSSTVKEPALPEKYLTKLEFESREAYVFVVSRLGKYVPWDPSAWPDEVKDQGCTCNNYSFRERIDPDFEETNIWECTACGGIKPLMSYVMWCESCGVPYVVRRSPDRTELCQGCGG